MLQLATRLAKATVGHGCRPLRSFVLRDLSPWGRTSSPTMEIKLHCANPTQLFFCSLMRPSRHWEDYWPLLKQCWAAPSLSEPRPHISQHKLEQLQRGWVPGGTGASPPGRGAVGAPYVGMCSVRVTQKVVFGHSMAPGPVLLGWDGHSPATSAAGPVGCAWLRLLRQSGSA